MEGTGVIEIIAQKSIIVNVNVFQILNLCLSKSISVF
jgi:hypothetical protein